MYEFLTDFVFWIEHIKIGFSFLIISSHVLLQIQNRKEVFETFRIMTLKNFSGGLSPYDFYGCNYYAADTAAEISASTSINGVHLADSNNLATNLFINRQQNFKSPVWYNADQYHGMFRNPHTQYPRGPLLSTITASTDVPNGRR